MSDDKATEKTTTTTEGAAADKATEAKPTEKKDAQPPAAKEKQQESEDSWLDALPEDKRNYVKGLKSEIVEKRLAAKTASEKLAALEAKEAEAEQAKLVEEKKFEKLWQDEQGQTTKLREQIKMQELRLEGEKAGLLYPDLLKTIADKVTFGKDGEVSGAAEAIAELKKSMPTVFKQAEATAKKEDDEPQSTGAAKKEPSPGARPATKAVADMTPAEYQAYKENYLEKLRG